MGNATDEDVTRAIGSALASLPELSRRSFLKLSGAGLVAAMAGGGLLSGCDRETLERFFEQIRNRPVRRNIATLGADDPVLNTYRDAVRAMKQLDVNDPQNPLAWTNQARIHFNHCPHGNWLFLPWHRLYLWYFEEACRQLTGNNGFALPYWNWTDNPRVPAPFWDQASPLYDGTRQITQNDSANPNSVGPAVIDSILAETNFLNFASNAIPLSANQRQSAGQDRLEASPHNHIHGFIRGNMGGYMSPLDPVFWLHHNRIDQLWVEWNITRGNPNTNDNNWTGRRFTEFFDRNGQPVDAPMLTAILLPLLSYRYDTQVP